MGRVLGECKKTRIYPKDQNILSTVVIINLNNFQTSFWFVDQFLIVNCLLYDLAYTVLSNMVKVLVFISSPKYGCLPGNGCYARLDLGRS